MGWGRKAKSGAGTLADRGLVRVASVALVALVAVRDQHGPPGWAVLGVGADNTSWQRPLGRGDKYRGQEAISLWDAVGR